jgi:hypothetical protein
MADVNKNPKVNLRVPVFGVTVTSLLLGWLSGAYFSDHVDFTLSGTDWDSVWAYLWLTMWPFCLVVRGVVYAWVFLAALLASVVAAWLLVRVYSAMRSRYRR